MQKSNISNIINYDNQERDGVVMVELVYETMKYCSEKKEEIGNKNREREKK